MKFETKFSVGDRAWHMKDNKPMEIVISAIEIFLVGTNQDRLTYNATNMISPGNWLDNVNLPEDRLFHSKNDLLDSL